MPDMAVDHTKIALLVRHIEGDKEKFLSDLQLSIRAHVSAKSPAQCLALVTTRDGSSVTWRIWDNVDYVERLVAYLRKRTYKQGTREYEVDSVLTGEILTLTVQKLSQHVLSQQNVIADVALTEILLGDATREQFLGALLAGKGAHLLTAKGKAMITAALLRGLQEKLNHFSASIASHLGDKVTSLLATVSKTAIVTTSAEIVTKVLATSSGKIILTRLSIMIAHSLGPMLAKLLAMPVVELALKKLIFAAVIGTMAKVIAAKIGMSVTAAIWWILGPILLAFLAKDIYDLPSKLGVGLADAICTDMRASYGPTLTNIVTELLVKFTTKEAIQSLAKALAEDPEVASNIGSLISVVAAECAT